MKTFMKYLLAVTVSLIVGGILGWETFSSRIKRRIIPVAQTQLRDVNVDFIEKHPDLDFHFSPTGNTLKIGGKLVKAEKDLDHYLTRVATISTSYWFVVSFNREVTIQQVRDVDARIRSFGFPKPQMLIEDNDSIQEERERLYSEIRISPLPH